MSKLRLPLLLWAVLNLGAPTGKASRAAAAEPSMNPSGRAVDAAGGPIAAVRVTTGAQVGW